MSDATTPETPTAPRLVRVVGQIVPGDWAMGTDDVMHLVTEAHPMWGMTLTHPTRGTTYHVSVSQTQGFWRLSDGK
jgi:hypothetical protein